MNLLRSLRRPAISSAFIFALFLSGVAFILENPKHGPKAVHAPIGRGCGTSGVRWIEFVAEDYGKGLVIRLLSDEDKRNLEESAVARAFVSVSERGTLTGVLAPTSVSQELGVRVLPMGTDSQMAAWSPADEQLTIGLLAVWFDAHNESRAASMIRTNTTAVHRTLISGYIYNTLWLGLLGVTIYSFGWLRDVGRESLGRQRLARGQCPSCAYPFAGLPAPICPECGENLPVTHTATARDASDQRSASRHPSTRAQASP